MTAKKHFFNLQFLVPFLMLLLSSCTYFSPQINLVKLDYKNSCDASDSVCNMPSLYRANQSITKSLNQLETKRNWSLTTNRALGAATFGLGVVAVAHGIHSGHSNAIKNASLGAGVTYLSSTLFAPISQTQSYQSGLTALTCVQNKSSLSLSLAASAFSELKDTDTLNCKPSIDLIAAAQKAYVVKNYAKNNDVLLANSVTTTANLIVNEINNQMITQTPNPAAFYEAARSIGQLPPFIAQPKVLESPLGIAAENNAPACSPEVEQSKIQKYSNIENTFIQSVNELDRLGQQCTLNPQNVDALTVGAEIYEVTKNSGIHQINIAGGRKPYFGNLSQEVMGLKIQVGSDTLIISAGADLVPNGSTTVTIKDSSLIPQTKQVIVKTK